MDTVHRRRHVPAPEAIRDELKAQSKVDVEMDVDEENERIFDLIQCLRSFSVSKHLVKTGTILESRCRGCFDAIDPNIFPARI